MRTADFHYDLPAELIAQTPAKRRDEARLLVLHRLDGRLEHREVVSLAEYLRPGDVLVLNNSRVIPARLRGRKRLSAGQVEVLLAEENAPNDWWVMLRPGKRVRAGTRIDFEGRPAAGHGCPPAARGFAPALPNREPAPSVSAVVVTKQEDGLCRLQFAGVDDIRDVLDTLGEVPLPPYIQRSGPPTPMDRERYQTVYAHAPGSVAAPTAGLHFTESMLTQLQAKGVNVGFVTLHVGLGTFAPVKTARVEEHTMHEEAFELPARTADAVNAARREGRRVLAVGTTTVRVLESAAAGEFRRSAVPGATSLSAECATSAPARDTPCLEPCQGRTRIFVYPPFRFRVVDALLTNFHLPESTLLMLVSAFAAPGETRGRELVLAAYAEAIRRRYRFYSYGDAMLIL